MEQRAHARRRAVEATFRVVLDWGTYRTLTHHAGLSPAEFEERLSRYYRDALL